MKSILPKPSKVVGFETSDGRKFEKLEEAQAHEATIHLGARTTQLLGVLGFPQEEDADGSVRASFAAKAAVAGEYIKNLATAHAACAAFITTTRTKPGRAAKSAPVKSAPAKSDSAKPAKKGSARKASVPAAPPAGDMSLDEAKKIVRKHGKARGPKPANVRQAIAVIAAAAGDTAKEPATKKGSARKSAASAPAKAKRRGAGTSHDTGSSSAETAPPPPPAPSGAAGAPPPPPPVVALPPPPPPVLVG